MICHSCASSASPLNNISCIHDNKHAAIQENPLKLTAALGGFNRPLWQARQSSDSKYQLHWMIQVWKIWVLVISAKQSVSETSVCFYHRSWLSACKNFLELWKDSKQKCDCCHSSFFTQIGKCLIWSRDENPAPSTWLTVYPIFSQQHHLHSNLCQTYLPFRKESHLFSDGNSVQ